jgi:hypothetical protein
MQTQITSVELTALGDLYDGAGAGIVLDNKLYI